MKTSTKTKDYWTEDDTRIFIEESYNSLVNEGFMRKEGKKYVWTMKGNIEIHKHIVMFNMWLHQQKSSPSKKKIDYIG